MIKRHEFSPEFWIEYKDSFNTGEYLDFYSELPPMANAYAIVRGLAKYTLKTIFYKGELIEKDAPEFFKNMARANGDKIMIFYSEHMNDWIGDEEKKEDEEKKSVG